MKEHVPYGRAALQPATREDALVTVNPNLMYAPLSACEERCNYQGARVCYQEQPRAIMFLCLYVRFGDCQVIVMK